MGTLLYIVIVMKYNALCLGIFRKVKTSISFCVKFNTYCFLIVNLL